jgi:hypothetical protein
MNSSNLVILPDATREQLGAALLAFKATHGRDGLIDYLRSHGVSGEDLQAVNVGKPIPDTVVALLTAILAELQTGAFSRRSDADAGGEHRDHSDPLAGLVDRVGDAPGAAFEPDVLAALGALRSADRAAFENLRDELKRAGFRRMVELDKAVRQASGAADERGPGPAQILVELAEAADVFLAPDDRGYATVGVNGHAETWPLRHKGFRRWLVGGFHKATGGTVGAQAIDAAIGVIEAKAYDAEARRETHVRTAGHGERIYLDLCDRDWRAVEVSAGAWDVVENPPVRFRRSSGAMSLPAPERGGTIFELREFLNVQSEGDFILAVAWLLASLRDRGPYPLLLLSGEQGTAKTTVARILRALVDPNSAPIRALPKEERDFFITAHNSHILAYDNVSGIPGWMSDALCRLSTGGGYSVRTHYENDDETLFTATRPAILNGIDDIAKRPDLAERAIVLKLEPIPEERRRPVEELWAEFELARPRILGSLLDLVAEGLQRLPETHLDGYPRMADFARWSTSCETAAWPAGTFIAAYGANCAKSVEDVLQASPLALALRRFMENRPAWEGTATTLLGLLADNTDPAIVASKQWPGSPNWLSDRLRRLAAFLRKVGLDIQLDEREATERRIRIERRVPCDEPDDDDFEVEF